jgi:hypothetical protein
MLPKPAGMICFGQRAGVHRAECREHVAIPGLE